VRLLLDLKARILTVLDSKGLALLAFDGIVVAATTFAAEKGGVFHRRGMARWLAILIIILALAHRHCFFVLFWGSLNWTNKPAHETHERHGKTH
jgi:hypothetical protein